MNAKTISRSAVIAAALAATSLASAATSASAAAPTASTAAGEVRIKDLGRIEGPRENALVGYGLVTGLAGTGDSARNRATRQSLANMLQRFDLVVPADDVNSRNVAAVMVTANLPAFARPGDAIDITVTSIGDARSLTGGTLLMAPLKGADGRTYALAQGAIATGGYKVDANGNVAQKNHPTTGSVPNGASVERVPERAQGATIERLSLLLNTADYTNATRMAAAINQRFGTELAQARDAGGVDLAVPTQFRERIAQFVTELEQVRIVPDQRARVVINERTGTVVSGGDVRIARITVSHGDLKVSIVTDNAVSQPAFVTLPGDGVRTQVVSNSRIEVTEREEPKFISSDAGTVSDLVRALSRMKTNTRDIISILRAIKSAGALHADLIIQ